MTDQEVDVETGAGAMLVPITGELVDPSDEVACGRALRTLREIKADVTQAISGLSDAIYQRSKVLGTKTIEAADDLTLVVGPDSAKVYDAIAIENDLREAGAPESLIREIVKEEVTYKVDARRAQQAARANATYGQIIGKHTTVEPRVPNVRTQ